MSDNKTYHLFEVIVWNKDPDKDEYVWFGQYQVRALDQFQAMEKGVSLAKAEIVTEVEKMNAEFFASIETSWKGRLFNAEN